MKNVLLAVLVLVGLGSSVVAMADAQQSVNTSNVSFCHDNVC